MKSSPVAVALVLLLLAGCEKTPTGPTTHFGAGVTLYQDSLFRGNGPLTFSADVPDLGTIKGPCYKGEDANPTSDFDDCVSSMRIPDGLSVTVYVEKQFKGQSATYTADVLDLDLVPGPCRPGFNDCISSFRLFRRQ